MIKLVGVVLEFKAFSTLIVPLVPPAGQSLTTTTIKVDGYQLNLVKLVNVP